MGLAAVKPKLASGSSDFDDALRVIAVAQLVADLHQENIAANDEHASGQYYDTESGLHYGGDRYWDPRLCRSITADRMSVATHVERWRTGVVPGRPPLEINPYSYSLNNPLRWIDRTGLEATAPGIPGEAPGTGLGDQIIDGLGRCLAVVSRTLGAVGAALMLCGDTPGGCRDCKKADDECYQECEPHLGRDRTDQGVPYRNCWVSCMKRKGCYKGDSPVE